MSEQGPYRVNEDGGEDGGPRIVEVVDPHGRAIHGFWGLSSVERAKEIVKLLNAAFAAGKAAGEAAGWEGAPLGEFTRSELYDQRNKEASKRMAVEAERNAVRAQRDAMTKIIVTVRGILLDGDNTTKAWAATETEEFKECAAALAPSAPVDAKEKEPNA